MLQDIPWGEVLEAVFRRRRTVIGVALAVFGLALLSVWLTPATYRAVSRIQLTADPASQPRAAGMSDKQLEAELAFLRSSVLVSRVLAKLGGDGGRAKSGIQGLFLRIQEGLASDMGPLEAEAEAAGLERRVRAAAENIEVEPVGRSNLVEVAYLSPSPVFAADFVNNLLAEHVERIGELSRESPELPFIQSQLDALLERWQAARQELDSFRSSYGTSVLSGDEQQLRALVGGLEAQRVAAGTSVLELKARVGYLKRQGLVYPATVESESRKAEPEAVKLLETRIMELQMQKSHALTRYTPTSLVVTQIEDQIDQAEQMLARAEREAFSESATARNPAIDALEVDMLQSMAKLTEAEARAEALSGQIENYRKKLNDLEVAVVQLERLQNEVDSARDAYQNYLREAETARQESARDEYGMVNLAIVQAAVPPRIAEPSRAGAKAATWGLLGLLIGVAIALFGDWLDPSVKSAAQTSRLTGLRILAEIPHQ